VEKAGGQLEAIILQENQVQVVHIGDRIAGRYRVTKITPDLVDALDETLVQSSMAKSGGAESEVLEAKSTLPPPAVPPSPAPAQPEMPAVATETTQPQNNRGGEPASSSLGYVQQTDGKVVAVVADGESVRLVPQTPTETLAQVTPPGLSGGAGILPPSGHGHDGQGTAVPVGPAEASAIQQASYRVSPPGVKASAAGGFSMTMAGGAAGTGNAVGSPANSVTAARPSGSTDRVANLPVEIKPVGFVEKGDGEFAAVLSQDDDIYIVRPGDRFAGRYRALNVSADLVEAVEEPPRQAPPPSFAAPSAFPDLLSASAQPAPSYFSNEDCPGCKFKGHGEGFASVPKDPPREVASPPPRSGTGILPVIQHGQDGHGTSRTLSRAPSVDTFIFQTLGTVETQDGEVQAIVADGSEVYLVKQGETFADQYRATSVDSILVLAVRVSPGELEGNPLTAQTESGAGPASKNLYGYLHSPSSGISNAGSFHEVDASGVPAFADLGVNLFSASPNGFEAQLHLFMADNSTIGF
jgi:hypothetical protein